MQNVMCLDICPARVSGSNDVKATKYSEHLHLAFFIQSGYNGLDSNGEISIRALQFTL